MTPNERKLMQAIGEVAHGLALREMRREAADPTGELRRGNWSNRADSLAAALYTLQLEDAAQKWGLG